MNESRNAVIGRALPGNAGDSREQGADGSRKGTLIASIVGAWLMASPLMLMAQDAEQMTHRELVEYLGVHPDFEDYLQEIEIRVSSRGEGAPTPARLFVAAGQR